MYSAGASPNQGPIPAPLDEEEIAGGPAASISLPLAEEEPARRLNAARGALIGLGLGAGSWVVIFALIRFLKA
jgi:hypothetical protein